MNKSEKKRIVKQTERILNVLRVAGQSGVTNAELSEVALRYGANLGELYKKGYKIDKVSLGNGLYNYTLISEPESEIVREKAIDVLLKEVEKYGIDNEILLGILNANGISVKYKANTYKA